MTASLPAAPLLAVAWRASQWVRAFSRVGVLMGMDRMRGRRSLSLVGAHLASGFDEIGGAAVKLAQQLSLRADVLPQDICDALAQLSDAAQPIPQHLVAGLIEAELGRPIAEVFAEPPDTLVGAASVACVYRARLHTGEDVAVKLQRPNIAQQFAQDLRVMELFFSLAEFVTFVRAGFFNALKYEMRTMFAEELTFSLEGRYQRMFQKYAERAGLDWVRSPFLHAELSTDRLLVSEFVAGISAGDLLTAVEGRDTQQLAKWAEDDITPAIVSRRVLRLSLWARFEATFFHADPHPGNVLIEPGGRLVMIDFGACGVTSPRTRKNHTEVLRLMSKFDGPAIARVMVADISPISHVDIHQLQREIEASFIEFTMATADDTSHWSERIIAGMWLKMMKVAQVHQLQLNLDTVRSIRSFLLYDTLAFRLDPSLDLEETHRYLRVSATRRANALLNAADEQGSSALRNRAVSDALDFRDRVEEMVWKVGPVVEASSYAFQQLTSTFAFAMASAVRVTIGIATIGLLFSIGRMFVSAEWMTGQLLRTVSNPIVLNVAAVVALLYARRLLTRLNAPTA